MGSNLPYYGDNLGGTMALIITSASFTDGGSIPSRYTCEGDDVSPPLSWDGVPNDARSLVLIVDDPALSANIT